MKQKICFFTIGFAFNRLVRMQYYEKIFSKDAEIFLFTTNKYQGKEEKSYQFEWDLKKTKIHSAEYNLLKLPFELRRFCRKNNIDRVLNIGYYTSCFFLLYAALLSKTDFIMNRFADLISREKSVKNSFPDTRKFLAFLKFFFLTFFSKRTIFVDYAEHKYYKKVLKLFVNPERINYLPAPVNTDLFKLGDKNRARKKLKISKDKKVILFVGRIGYEKTSDILKKLIIANPDIFFILIGRVINKNYIDIKAKNFAHIEKKSSEKLVDYYNAADLSYCLHRLQRGGLGLTAEQALATGTPAISPFRDGINKNKALFQIPIDFKSADKTVKEFFRLSFDEKNKISKEARSYAEKYYSDNANKQNYLKYYLE